MGAARDPVRYRNGPDKDGLASTGHLHPGLRRAVKLPNAPGREKKRAAPKRGP